MTVTKKLTTVFPSLLSMKGLTIFSISIALGGAIALFLIDGGIGLISAGIVELIKWGMKH